MMVNDLLSSILINDYHCIPSNLSVESLSIHQHPFIIIYTQFFPVWKIYTQLIPTINLLINLLSFPMIYMMILYPTPSSTCVPRDPAGNAMRGSSAAWRRRCCPRRRAPTARRGPVRSPSVLQRVELVQPVKPRSRRPTSVALRWEVAMEIRWALMV